jgi:hypothetical protein
LAGAWIWQAQDAICANARIADPKNDAVIARRDTSGEPIPATPDQIEKFVTQWVAEIPEERKKEEVRKILRERLTVANDNTAALEEAWRRCESESLKTSQEEFDGRHVAVLRKAVCDDKSDGATIGTGVARNWIPKEKVDRESSTKDNERLKFRAELARALLGEDGKPCAPAEDYDENTKMWLRDAAGPPPAPK